MNKTENVKMLMHTVFKTSVNALQRSTIEMEYVVCIVKDFYSNSLSYIICCFWMKFAPLTKLKYLGVKNHFGGSLASISSRVG